MNLRSAPASHMSIESVCVHAVVSNLIWKYARVPRAKWEFNETAMRAFVHSLGPMHFNVDPPHHWKYAYTYYRVAHSTFGMCGEIFVLLKKLFLRSKNTLRAAMFVFKMFFVSV